MVMMMIAMIIDDGDTAQVFVMKMLKHSGIMA